MTNKEVYDVSGGSTFHFSTVSESEKLVHWVATGGGFMRARNPNGVKFFAGKFYLDSEAAKTIESIEEAILNSADDNKIKRLCVRLDKCMPIIEGVKYVMTLKMAYYLARTHRPMDDIYFVDEHSNEKVYDMRLREYVSGRYAS